MLVGLKLDPRLKSEFAKREEAEVEFMVQSPIVEES